MMSRHTSRSIALASIHPHLRSGASVLSLLLAFAAASLFAAGADGIGAKSDGVTIPYGDLDLSTIDGAAELERRLVEAATIVCIDLDSPAVPREAYDRCRMDAVAGAILILRRPPSAVAAVTS
jgi:UrcA family protein